MAKAPASKPIPDKADPLAGEMQRQMMAAVYAKVRVADMPPTLDAAGADAQQLVREVVDACMGVAREMGLRIQSAQQEAEDRKLDALKRAVEQAVAGVNVNPVDGETYEDTLIRRVKVWGSMFSRRRDRPA